MTNRNLPIVAPLLACCLAGLAACSAPSAVRARTLQDGSAPVDQDGENTALAKKSQNPIANLISLPLQNNTDFGIGPGDDTKNTLNIQPVIPVEINDDWLLITRTIVPVINQPLPGGGDEFGLGDTVFSTFFSPTDSGEVTWGVGPIALLPTSTDDALGAGEWGGGLSAVALWMGGPWVAGGLINNVWSFESSAVNVFTVQPFINYNLDAGWYLTTAPIITSNWEAESGERWSVPIGGGLGRVFRIGTQPINCSAQYYNYVESPESGPDWQLRLQIQFLFPTG